MIGFIVKHEGFGLGRILAVEQDRVMVEYFGEDGDTHTSTSGLARAMLPMGTRCKAPKGFCRITKRVQGKSEDAAVVYTVEYESSRHKPAKISEEHLTPLEAPVPSSPLVALASATPGEHLAFKRREALERAWLKDLRDGQGARALLSSRIDLRPHQAYVAATVILDRQRRYILADEVGLGKTIEAGIVIHDLLSRKPEARILILCPGALTQQWFCEIFAKFCNQMFSLPELYGGGPKRIEDRTIISFSDALAWQDALAKGEWDMVVIDEAHHLLSIPKLYRLAQSLSTRSESLLLLSALPAQEKEQEYLRLLALLEPGRYDPDNAKDKKRFRELYARQAEIGQKIGYILRRLEGMADDPTGRTKALLKASELAQMPVLCDDSKLADMVEALGKAEASFADDAREMLHYVGDAYRINRRILRNRRARLIESSQIKRVERQLRRVPFSPDQFEVDAGAAMRGLLQSLQESGLDEESLVIFARQAFQALSSPRSLRKLLSLYGASMSEGASGRAVMALDSMAGYSDWEEQVRGLWAKAKPHIDRDAIDRATRASAAWIKAEGSWPRMSALLKCLRQRRAKEPDAKIIVFAGFPGLAAEAALALKAEFGKNSVASFLSGSPSQEKEDEVRRFKGTPSVWLLVSDESGGEGRNFQFAAELVHFDLPWHAARVEQRIGRLDRLGRERLEVMSNVIFTEGSEEEGLLACLELGLEVFHRSISGLEFALRGLEAKTASIAVSKGIEGLSAFVPTLKLEAENERESDDAQEVFDVGSSGTSEEFRRLQSMPGRDRALGQAFEAYFASLSSHKTIWWDQGVVTFKFDGINGVDLKPLEDQEGHLQPQKGTFLRSIAQERPDLKFFSVGNKFCDAVFGFLSRSVKGRWYAVDCKTASHPRWVGFEAVYKIASKEFPQADKLGFASRLERIFSAALIRCFISEDGTPAAGTEGEVLLKIRRSLDSGSKGRTWWDLEGEVDQHYKDWPSKVKKTEALARKLAHKEAEELLAPILSKELERINEQISQAKRLEPPGWKEEVKALKGLAAALEGWSIELNGIGFLSVNGGLHE